jgi:rod shape-determining protein MreC
MEALLSRYRNLSILLLLVVAQLILLAYQVKTGDDVRLIRVWAVAAVTPLAQLLESARGGTGSAFTELASLKNVRQDNAKMRQELDRLRLENQKLRSDVELADRAQTLAIFQKQALSKTVAARVIGTGTGVNSRVVFVDRGTRDGVEKGMAVINPAGIVGRVVSAYPQVSMVMLATEPSFVAGVISQKSRQRGLMRGRGTGICDVENIANLQKLEDGEWFFTSGDDRIFPKGLPVGQVKLSREGTVAREATVQPAALISSPDEVLIVTQGVHGTIPAPGTPASQEVSLLPPPAEEAGAAPATNSPQEKRTEADAIRERYKRIGEAQGHRYGTTVGRTPDFNRAPPPVAAGTAAPGSAPAAPGEVKPPAAKAPGKQTP